MLSLPLPSITTLPGLTPALRPTLSVHRNPTEAERAEIDRKFGNINWELFGPASDEEGGKAMLEEHINMVQP